MISKNFNSHVSTEVNLADKSMHAYKKKKNSLRDDLKKYMNRLRLVHGEISLCRWISTKNIKNIYYFLEQISTEQMTK